MLVVLLMVPTGLLVYYLWPNTFWLAQAFAGAIAGVYVTLVYANGSARQTAEFWHGTCPRWIRILFGATLRDDIQPMWSQHKAQKVFALIVAVNSTIISTVYAVFDNYHVSGVVIYTIIWITGIVLSERYFKRRYTRIKDWKDL